MKSIRLSLIVYFLALLALALGAASGFAYWTTAEIVQTRRNAAVASLTEHQRWQCRRDASELDQRLLAGARSLAGTAQLKFEPGRARMSTLASLGILTAGPSPFAYVQVPTWVAEGVKGPLSSRIFHAVANEVHFTEEDLPHDPDGVTHTYFQITTEWGSNWRSRSLEDQSLPIDPDRVADLKVFDWKYDDVTLVDGSRVRRVILKAPAARFRFVGSTSPRRPERPERPPDSAEGTQPTPRPARPERPERPTVADSSAPTLLVHFATDTASRDEAIAAHQVKLQEGIAELDREADSTLTTLRNRLIAIGLITFTGTVLGGLALVGLGLAPLQRLSDAVSRVSEKDFRLQMDERRLPGELRPIVDRLSQTLGLLQRAFAREKQAAADISHELRTPLAALLTTTEVSLRKPRNPEDYRQTIEDCRGLGLQMSQLVERLLALARLDAGVDTLRPTEVDAAAVAGQCLSVVRPLAEAHEVTLDFQPEGPAALTTDPIKLREVVTNLLHNAIAYNRPQGQVAMKVERQNGDLLVEVSDTGIGMTPEVRAHIFERFYRADVSRHATGVHAGLGLSIVKGYVDLMGGTIGVESAEGQGTTFRVLIPAEPTALRPKEHL
jgi:signal transduction histidine kinase